LPELEDELGDVVKKARAGLGLSLATLAERSGLTESQLQAIEVYTGHPDEAEVRRLAEALRLRPEPLWELAQDSWSAPDVPWTVGPDVTIERLTNHYPEHCYILSLPSGETLIVDPGAEPERVLQAATRDGRRPLGILVTHRHQDHTGAVVPVQAATGAPVFVHGEDVEGVKGVPTDVLRTFGADGALDVQPFQVHTLHTPGHTPGSATFVLRRGEDVAAFCGDTLFAGSAGSPRAGYASLLDSLRHKLAGLPSGTVFYPGHGPSTTLANERERNPFL
jgi:hydroxyacylglutathione hydrolase